ncbi:MAG: prepilin-type N-terminal cleavage/methylation domain-containing protein [Candidatus Omnitrophota bacterium]
MRTKRNKNGFTLIEMVVVLAVISVLAAILFPTLAKHISDSKLTRATNECQVITAAVMMLYKDTGKWPCTNEDGPSGRVNRVLSGAPTDPVPTSAAPGARTGAALWGTYAGSKPLSDYLYFNNPDNETGTASQNETGQDYSTSGESAWRGPYIDKQIYLDPWGNQYVINARYFPGGTDSASHTVLVLSAGKDGLWSTAFDDSINRLSPGGDGPLGPNIPESGYTHDDVGVVVTTNNN